MTATVAPPPHANGQRPVGRRSSASVQAVTRNRGRIAAGLALVATSAVLAALVYGNVGHRAPVLVAAHPISPGQMITDVDLKVVNVGSDPGAATVPASERSRIVGRRAAVGLVAGSLLAPGGVTEGPGLPAGSTLVGTVLKPGQYPIGLRQGDTVEVVIAGGDTSSGGSPDPVMATVAAVSTHSGPDGTAVSLAVPSDRASSLALAGAASRLILTEPVR